jgi:predicted glutamine amidotransferase
MCRLLGYVAASPTSVVEVLGQEDFDAFTALTAVHDDGWGMAWKDADDGLVASFKSPDSAERDATYARLARQDLGRAGIVHLRWATPGLAVRPENTHPFVEGGYAFAHNGSIARIDRLESLLTKESLGSVRGDTDSERYFRFVLQCIDESADEAAGLARALSTLTKEFPDASLNALLLTPTRLFAVHINSRAAAPKELRSPAVAAEHLSDRHNDEYFAMDFQRTPSSVRVISSGIDPDGWTSVPEDAVAVIDLATLQLSWMR